MKSKTIHKMRLLAVLATVFAVILFSAIMLLNPDLTVKAEEGDFPAMSEEHTHCICGGNVKNDGHTNHSPVTFQPYDGGDFDYEDGDSGVTGDRGVAYLYLTKDVVNNVINKVPSSNRVNDSGILVINRGQTLYLCLNGHSLKNALTDNNVIDVEGGALYLCDCAGGGTIGGRKSGSNSGAIWVSGGEFYMYGGVITGSHGLKNGGGVFLDKNASFTMHGGAVTDNSVTRRGGGVYLNDKTNSFTMYGGEISDNVSPESGGGVIMNGGTFTMHGGVIKNNKSGSYGGGVFTSGGTFVMYAGEISSNTAANGGGVCVTTGNGRGTFTMNDGEISHNDAINGGGVYIWDKATFNMNKGAITGNSATYGGGICMYSANADESSGDGDKNNVLRIAAGVIKNNTASGYGGGVCCFERSNIVFSGGGAVIVSENENGNLYLADNGCTLSIDSMYEGSLIGVSSFDKPEKNKAKRVFKTLESLDRYGEYFCSDNENFVLTYGTDRINLTADFHKSTLKYVTGCDQTIPDEVKTDLTNESITFTVTGVVPAAKCLNFKGWALTADAETAQYGAGDTLTVAGETILYAVWESAPHNLTEVAEVEATCEHDGVEGHYECGECGKKFINGADGAKIEVTDDSELVISGGHKFGAWQEKLEATCEHDGVKGHYECSECGKKFIDGADGAKIEVTDDSELVISGGHKFGAWQEKIEATAEKEGTLAHKDCERCGKHFDANDDEITDLTIEKLPAPAQPIGEGNGLSKGAVAGISIGATAVSVFCIEGLAYAIFKIVSKKRKLK